MKLFQSSEQAKSVVKWVSDNLGNVSKQPMANVSDWFSDQFDIFDP